MNQSQYISFLHLTLCFFYLESTFTLPVWTLDAVWRSPGGDQIVAEVLKNYLLRKRYVLEQQLIGKIARTPEFESTFHRSEVASFVMN